LGVRAVIDAAAERRLEGDGKVLHYTGVIDQATGSLTGERPDGVTWQSTGSMRCIGGADTLPPA
jgi:hypothetical protein